MAHERAADRPPHERTVLPNGLRVVSQSLPGARSASAMLLVGVGSRQEDERHAGVSHLIEHLVFKGTQRWPAPGALSEAIEAVGGEVNASTDRELTVLSTKVPARHLDTALDVIAEMALRPLLRASDLVAERPVIVDEIRMYEDSPDDRVHALFDALLFGRHPLGREIAGSPSSVRRIPHRAVVEHWREWYRAENMVLAVAGAIDHRSVVGGAVSWWEADGRAAPQPLHGYEPAPETAPAGRVSVHYRQLGQGNLVLGMPGVARGDPDRWALDLLCAVLGDGMSSRLFIELRELRSLAYEVSTFTSMFADTGTFGVYAGFDPLRSADVVRAILDQLARVVEERVPEAELEKARAYTIGRIELRMEDSGAVASWLGHGELLLGEIMTVEDVVERLQAVTADELLRVARRLLRPELARIVALGPFRGSARLGRLLAA